MVSSSKKKRGKQRKAIRQQNATDSDSLEASINPDQLAVFYTPDGRKSFIHPTHHKLAALHVQRGDNHITGSMITLAGDSPDDGIGHPNISLVQSDILSTILNFLGRCEHETFDKVIADARGHVFTPNGALLSNLGGDLVSLVVWINVIRHAAELEPSCMLQIAENIGPLVRCMCNDTKRLFFKSNKYWLEGIARFVELVGYIIIIASTQGKHENLDEQVISTLLKQEGLLTSLVQWGFWGEKSRPDIAKELNSLSIGTETDVTWIASVGKAVTKQLITHTKNLKDDNGSLTNEGKNRLQAIGSTPIINKAYDPTCMVSYVVGSIRHIKTSDWDGADLTNLQSLIFDSDCVDKGVIREVVDFGLNYTTDSKTSQFVCLLSNMMILQCDYKYKSNDMISHPNDTRTAFAVRAGLIGMCLGFVEKFGKLESKESLLNNLLFIFDLVHKVSLHQKTAKAIRSKRQQIEEKLVSLEGSEAVTSNPKCKELLDMIRSTLSANGSFCCRCNKSLSKTEVKLCNGCGCMSYCSRSCQKEDWFNGHNVACCKSYTTDLAGQFQGRVIPVVAPDDERAARKMEELEKNTTMVQLKLFLDNSETILKQASSLNLPLYDCVAQFDLRKCPIKVETVKSLECLNGFETSRSKDNITCLYCSDFYNGELLEDGRVPNVTMQRLFPHEWLNRGREKFSGR